MSTQEMKAAIAKKTEEMTESQLQIVLELIEKINSEPIHLVRENNVAYFFSKYNSVMKKLAE